MSLDFNSTVVLAVVGAVASTLQVILQLIEIWLLKHGQASHQLPTVREPVSPGTLEPPPPADERPTAPQTDEQAPADSQSTTARPDEPAPPTTEADPK